MGAIARDVGRTVPKESAVSDLLPRPHASWRAPVDVQLGGVRVYAASEQALRVALDRLGAAMCDALRTYDTLDSGMLLTAVARALSMRFDQRVFNAVIGFQLRLGRFDRIPCAAESGKTFRVLLAMERAETFATRCDEVRAILVRDRTVGVSDVRDRYFRDGWGGWSAASHILCRLALTGCAIQKDRYTFVWPQELESACRPPR